MTTISRSFAWRTLLSIALTLLLAAAIGLMFGLVWQALTLALALYLGTHIYRLLQFDHWLRNRRTAAPPDYEGIWGDVIAVVDRLYRRKNFHKRRVIRLLREYRRLTTALPDGAVLLNVENEILWANQRAADWLKLKRKRDYGVRIENLVRHPDFIAYMQHVEGAETATGVAGSPAVIPMPGEVSRWISIYLVLTRNVPQRLLIVRDVTRQMLLESMRKDFVANASHELRSPLTVISGYLDAIADDDHIDTAWKEPFAEMRRQAERMRAIINDLLELSRLEEFDTLARDDVVDVPGILAMLRKEVLTLPQRPEKIVLRLDSHAGLRGVERELSSVFGNLVTNAVKYTPTDGEIEMRWWVDVHGAHFAVRDTGIGIASEHIPRLTERFYRVDAGRSRAMGGSGLGLAIVKHALQRYDATLEAQSELGKGSTFTCHFPLARVVARSHEP